MQHQTSIDFGYASAAAYRVCGWMCVCVCACKQEDEESGSETLAV